MKLKTLGALTCICLLAAVFRLVGINWDQNQHLHPDERFLTMVAQAVKWPNSLQNYLDTDHSPANPNNIGFDFYVYGTLPVYFVKFIAEQVSWGNYDHLVLVGRFLSALVDTFCVVLVFLIARRLKRTSAQCLVASLLYALMALPIQLSHFFAMDPYLVLFSLISVYFALCLELSLLPAALSGIGFALAFSSKISAVVILPVIALCFISYLVTSRHFRKTLLYGLIFGASAIITLRFAQPYLFAGAALIPTHLNPKFLSSIKELQSYNTPESWFPPGVQWLHTAKGLFPAENIVLWGLGIPLAALSFVGLIYALARLKRDPLLSIPLLAILCVFGYQSTQFAEPMRYFYPLYPFLAIVTGSYLIKVSVKFHALTYVIFFFLLLWPAALMSVYSHPHTRVVATDWVKTHIPPGSTITCEHWDDCIPLGGSALYQFVELPLYNPDAPEKLPLIQTRLATADYLILSSNRLYGSISSAPDRYPQTKLWYEDLFAGRLGFVKVAEFTSRPNLPIPAVKYCLTPPGINYGRVAATPDCFQPGISFVDDYADETWTVYDHPKVTIFKKTSATTPQPLISPHRIQ